MKLIERWAYFNKNESELIFQDEDSYHTTEGIDQFTITHIIHFA